MTLRIAFYKNTRPGINGLYNRGVRFIDHGPYSHVELIFSDGQSASASFMDGGVRFKTIQYSQENWDIFVLPEYLEVKAKHWFENHKGQPYDLKGNIRFIAVWCRDDVSSWFCSEAIAAALGIHEPWRFGPNGLASLIKSLIDNQYYQPPTV